MATETTDPDLNGGFSKDVILPPISNALAAFSSDATFAVAFSGGLDSTVLLHATVAYAGAARCVAFHIHHGLSQNADTWLAHCAAVARVLGVRFISSRVVVDNRSAHGVEAAARNARYQALSELCTAQQVSALLVGHHADDQAETVLLQLLRGTGLAGIAAMPKKRTLHPDIDTDPDSIDPTDTALNIKKAANVTLLLRPWLTVPRAAIKTYAVRHHLQWIEDETNRDLHYTRNVLRHKLLPGIATHFPAYRQTLVRAANHMADAQTLLNELAEMDLCHVCDAAKDALNKAQAPRLSRTAFLKLSLPRAANLIRYWMRILGLPTASSAWIDHLLRQLHHTPINTALRIDHSGSGYRHRLYAYRDQIGWEVVELPNASLQTAAGSQTVSGTASNTPSLSNTPILHWSGERVWPLAPWRGQLLFLQTKGQTLCFGHSDNYVSAQAYTHASPWVPIALLRSALLSARARQGAERLRQSANGPSRTLKNLFQEAGVPAWRRHVPLIYLGQQLLFVPYVGVNYDKSLSLNRPADLPGEPQVCLAWRAAI